jgi:gliding motility-associated-like protein
MKYFFILLFYVLICCNLHSQIVYYQDVCKCGVTGAGFSTGLGVGSGSFSLDLDSQTGIRKAFLLVLRYGRYAADAVITINNTPFEMDSSSFSGFYFTSPLNPNSATPEIFIHTLDVTNWLSEAPTNDFNVDIPLQLNSCIGCQYSALYLYVLYDDSLSSTNLTSYVLLNDKPDKESVFYQLTEMSAKTLNSPLGFATFFDRMGNNNDGSYLSFYDGVTPINLGLMFGPDNVNSFWYGAGVKGHFNYQNNVLYGLDDDTPDYSVGGSDGLIDVKEYLNNNELSWQLEYETPFLTGFNIYSSVFLTYSTPCDTFSVSVPNDTTVCAGENLQLNASGGTSTGSATAYEWSASTPAALNDLSCTDCPNPIFSGEASRFYTVRIWNNDSCSLVRPVKINVRPRPLFGAITTTPSECGASTGSVSVSVAAGTASPVSFTLNDTLTQSSGLFSNLAAGNYTLSFTDGNGCVSLDTIITVAEVNTTVSQFTVSPGYGTVPLQVILNNTSQNATNFLWSVNGSSMGAILESYVCDPSGVYTIELIAWQHDPSCADTFSLSVTAIDRLIVPTAFTPDGDGVNDFWELPNIDVIYPENSVVVFNRWGSVVYESEKGKYQQNPWKGDYEGKPLPVGTYYFIIQVDEDEEHDLKGSVTVVR